MSDWAGIASILPLKASAIPAAMRQQRQFVCWKLEDVNDRTTKVPYTPHGWKASSTDPSTWSSLDRVLSAYECGAVDGIGFVFTEDDPFVFIDLDDAIDDAGQVKPEAAKLVQMLGGYTERSPSGKGLHVFVRGTKPGERCRAKTAWGEVEIYETGRFSTLTGHVLPGHEVLPDEDRSAAIASAYHSLFDSPEVKPAPISRPPQTSSVPASLEDAALLDHARQAANGTLFCDLFDRGNTSLYGDDHSRADSALATLLLWWSGGDHAQADRLFRQSALMRPKWDEQRGARTYGQLTLDKADELLRGEYFSPNRSANAAPPHEATPSAERVNGKSPSFACTDLGNAERLAYLHGHDLRYVAPFGRWFVFSGTHWREDETGEITRRAKQTVRAIKLEAKNETNDGKREALLKHEARSESVRQIRAMIELAQSEPGIAIMPDDLDANPMLFNVANATLDLETGKPLPHNRNHLITKLAPVDFIPGAKAPRFRKFLSEIFDGDKDLIAYVQRLFGYALTGSISEQCFPVLWGTGANGKSTLLEVIRRVMGDYAMHTPSETLMPSRPGSIPNDVARLRGARFVTAVETGERRHLNEQLIKQVTGGEPVTARFLRQEFFEFRPAFTVFLATNHKPTIRGTDHGIWRRLHLIPFNVTIPKEKQEQKLDEQLWAERSGVLAWLIEGCLEWQQIGLQPPEAVQSATAAYRGEMDVFAAFLDECCETGISELSVQASRLWSAFQKWADRSGEDAGNQRAFGVTMTERGFERTRRNGYVWYTGIGLRALQNETGGHDE